MHRNAFKLSAVRPTITSGGDTSVLMSKATLTNPHKRLNFLMREASVIFIAFAERTRNITDILREKKMYLTEKKVMTISPKQFISLSLYIHAIQQITTIKIKNNCYVFTVKQGTQNVSRKFMDIEKFFMTLLKDSKIF